MKLRKTVKKFLSVVVVLACICGVAALCLNAHVKNKTADSIITHEEALAISDADCILVLGCQVKEDGVPSHMLEDRIKRGIALYQDGAAPKLLMSGDHGRTDYNEVGTMKTIAIDAGVPSQDVFMDHAGFSTYETVYRAKEIFEADKVIIVTQEYHLYRALYIAEQLGVEAYGVSSDLNTYGGQSMRDAREVLARCKDWLMCIFKPEPTYLGDALPVSGNGDLTNDN